MAQRIKIQILRATSATRTSYTPDVGELIYETDTGNIFIGDGVTAGGNPMASTAGSVTDASNEGTAGVGPFIQNNGGILEFKNINANSNKISVTNDAGNNEIKIDVVEGNIDYNNLQNLPTLGSAADNDEGDFATAAQGALADSAIQPGDDVSDLNNDAGYLTETTHDALPSDNPHSVTKTQVGLSNVPNVDATQRANHTGTQLASTISNFAATVRSTVLTGLSLASATAVTASDTILQAIGKLQAQLNARVFGTEYVYEESLGQSQTNSTTFQTKVTLSTGTIPAGTYRIGWSYNWSHAATADDFEARVMENGATQIMFHSQEPQDSGVDQQIEAGGFVNRTLTAGSHSFTLQYRTDDPAQAAFIRTAKLEFWRVS